MIRDHDLLALNKADEALLCAEDKEQYPYIYVSP